MTPTRILLLAATLVACARPAPAPVTPAGEPTAAADAATVAERYRVDAIAERRFTHAQLWDAMAPALRSPALRVTEIGRSIQGRPIRAVSFGNGPTRVLLWSQMHGDESTATMSLADIVAWMADAARPDPLRDRLAEALTVVMVPMLNPDGAELFQRENAIGIDVNRDARRLVTPEARALKALRDSIRPQFGFNLHDQNARTLAGVRGEQVAIALLAPAADRERSWGETRTAARHVAAVIGEVLQRRIPRRVAKYDDTFEPRAFGDLMQQWGTSTVLIESGALPDDPEKQRLRALNVVAILSALDAIAGGTYRGSRLAAYDDLPFNARAAMDLLVRGGHIVYPGREPVRADIVVNYDEPVARRGPRVRDVGDLASVIALDTLDATGQFIHPSPEMLVNGYIRIGAPAKWELRRTP